MITKRLLSRGNETYEQWNIRIVPHRGVYPPLSGGSQPPPPPPSPLPMVHVYMHYTYHTRCVGARRNNQSSEIIIEGAKHLRIEEGDVEKFKNLKFIPKNLELKPCSG